MATRPTITTVASGAKYSTSQLNANFQALRDAFDNLIGRDGTSGDNNTITGDVDFGDFTARNVTIGSVQSSVDAAAASATAAATSATNASTSASAASTSATNAAASATSAASSAASAEAAASSVGFSDVVFVTSAQSPITITSSDSGKLYNCDTSGGAITFTLPSISALTLPFVLGVKKATGDANAVTINTDGTDQFDDGTTSKELASQYGTTLIPDVDPTPDKWTAADWSGASIADGAITTNKLADNAVTVSKIEQLPADTILGNNTGVAANAKKLTVAQVKTMLAVTTPVVGTVRNLRVSVAPSGKTCTWAVDEIIVETALGGTAYKGASKTFAFDGSTTGANGMDTGSTPTSGNLAVYAIYNPTTDTWACLGQHIDSATEVYGGANMPSGYVASALIFHGKTDGSANFVTFTQRDRKVWRGRGNVLSGGTATTYTSVSLSSIVPPTAKTAFGVAGMDSTSTNLGIALASDSSGTAETVLSAATVSGFTFNNFSGSGPFELPMMTAQTMYYKVPSSGSARIDINGYSF